MAYSYVRYTGNGSTSTYTFSFPYIRQEHVKVRLNGVLTTAFSFASSSSITLTTPPAAGVIVEIRRETPKDDVIVNFTDGSVLKETELDLLAIYNLYLAQETSDTAEGLITQNSLGDWNAQNKKISNIADPTSDQDAVTKKYHDSTFIPQMNALVTSAGTQASNASASASAAAASATAAASSASSASTSATNASTSATLSSDWASKTTGQVAATDYSAKAWAIGGTGVSNSAKDWATKTGGPVEGSLYSAKYYADSVSTNTSAAAASATSAANSATSAAGSATAAASSATSAATQATNAASSASTASTQATNAASSASAASTSATNAASSASSASSSATSAATSATNASNSASAAASSATSAASSAAAAAAVIASGMYSAVQDKTGSYTVVAADAGDLIRVTTSGGNALITLPLISSVTDGFKVAIAKWSGDSNTVTVSRVGSDLINGSTTYVIDTQYKSATFVADYETNTWYAAGTGGSGTNVVVDTFSGNATNTSFTLSGDPGSKNNTQVVVSGVFQLKSNYTLSGTTLTFTSAPPAGTNNIEVIWSQPLPIGVPSDGTITDAKLAPGFSFATQAQLNAIPNPVAMALVFGS